jgi:hypothetical protein
MVRDFSPTNTFAWGPLHEGSYLVMVRVKDSFDAMHSTSAVVPATVNSRVTGTEAVVTPTLNPLVALYSAPPCQDGTMHVKFRPASSANDVPWRTTNTLPCVRLVIVTVTPGSTPPCESWTDPETVALVVCARRTVG